MVRLHTIIALLSSFIHSEMPNFEGSTVATVFTFAKEHFLQCVIALYFLSVLSSRYRPGLARIPGPTLAKWTKLWRLYDVYKCQSHQTAIRLHQQHGPLVRIAPNVISVGDPKEIKTIYGLTGAFTKVRSLNLIASQH
jgi:hypothetical protein